ncbi:MAG TPA: twin-arginine translocase TatA/TatE family subunit [Chloroflexota bacterium]|nr:twin-arginine translocase TatA/TatE family subunit [Chloroflexota bacterium]
MLGHIPELLLVLGIALIVFGPEKLPEVAANTGKMYRELRQIMDDALHPQETHVPEDFSTYYHEAMWRSGEDAPAPVETEIDLAKVREFTPHDEPREGEPPSDSPV